MAVLKVGATAAGATPPPPTRVRWPATSASSARWSRRPAAPGRTTCTTCSSWPRRSPFPERGSLAARGRRSGLAILTCSGGDSGLAADEAGRLGLELPALGAATVERLATLLPNSATIGNPLDYTAMIWGERERLAGIVRAVAADPVIDQLLLFYDEPGGMEAGLRASWDGVREGLADGASGSGVPALVASTLPELLQSDSAAAFIARGVPAVAGLRTALACVAALRRPPADPARLRAIAAAAAAPRARRRALAVGGRGEGAVARARHRGARRSRRQRRRGCCAARAKSSAAASR